MLCILRIHALRVIQFHSISCGNMSEDACISIEILLVSAPYRHVFDPVAEVKDSALCSAVVWTCTILGSP